MEVSDALPEKPPKMSIVEKMFGGSNSGRGSFKKFPENSKVSDDFSPETPRKSKDVSPRKSIVEKVFGGSNKGSMSFKKSSNNEDNEGGMELMEIGGQRTKNVLILMSDTGGGHRASAEAIRDAFQIEFGDEYRVGFVLDLLLQLFFQIVLFFCCSHVFVVS
jgi:hypothetical protein